MGTYKGIISIRLIHVFFFFFTEITMDVIAAQAFVFYAAGFETSSTIMTFCLYELVLNPDIQTRLREEIDAAFSEPNAEITYEAINGMEYLDKVINGMEVIIIIIIHGLYRSPNITRAIKSRKLRWAGHVARMEEGRSAF